MDVAHNSLVTNRKKKVPSGKDVFTQVGTKEFHFALQHMHCVNNTTVDSGY